MNPRIREGIDYVAREFSCERNEFRQYFRGGADMLLDGLVSDGYVREAKGRFQLTDKGMRAQREAA